MANSSPRLADNRRASDAISTGVLTRTYPLSGIQAVLKATETESIRERAIIERKPTVTLIIDI